MFSDEHSPHMICLNETTIYQRIGDELLKTDGYHNIVHKDCDNVRVELQCMSKIV